MQFRKTKETTQAELGLSPVVPTGTLRRLKPEDVIPHRNNPRQLFDEEPLRDLRENIREHGVLVPITVYPIKGKTNKFGILDGERRHRCCVALKKEGKEVDIPANIVEPPTKIAGLLYMFSIHNFREQWELMPTALSLKTVMDELGTTDNQKLTKFTGLSEPQIERCKKLLAFPQRFQELSLDSDPRTRIPSNFWIEALPVIDIALEKLPDLAGELGRDGITDKLVEKYRNKNIKSVIHFRRVREAFDLSVNERAQDAAVERLRQYITDPTLETRRAFDEFVEDNRRIHAALQACDSFMTQLERAKLEYIIDKEDVTRKLGQVQKFVEELLAKLEGSDEPLPLFGEIHE